MNDPYQVLGVNPSATDDEVKKAYRELSRKYHPDNYAGTNNPLADLAEDKFKEIQAAYTQIMDMRKNGTNSYQNSYQNNTSGTYNTNQGYSNNQGYENNSYGGGSPFQNQRQNYGYYGQNYGRNPYGYPSGGCGTGNLCCDIWCADTLCECMGGDLCSCF